MNKQEKQLKKVFAQLLREFSADLLKKLMRNEQKYGFGWAWRAANWQLHLQRDMLHHYFKGDPRDTGIYSLFAWLHKWRTAPEDPNLPYPDNRNFVVLALKHETSGGSRDGAPFWGPEGSGYRMALSQAALLTVEEAYGIADSCDKGEMQVWHYKHPGLRQYLARWSQVRAAEFDLFHQLRDAEDRLRTLAAVGFGFTPVTVQVPDVEPQRWSPQVLVLWSDGGQSVSSYYNATEGTPWWLGETTYEPKGRKVVGWQPLPPALPAHVRVDVWGVRAAAIEVELAPYTQADVQMAPAYQKPHPLGHLGPGAADRALVDMIKSAQPGA